MPTRLHGDPRRCPIGDCGSVVRAGNLMCPRHWRTVPQPLQLAVNRTWRAFNTSGSGPDWADYTDARAAAITAAGGTP